MGFRAVSRARRGLGAAVFVFSGLLWSAPPSQATALAAVAEPAPSVADAPHNPAGIQRSDDPTLAPSTLPRFLADDPLARLPLPPAPSTAGEGPAPTGTALQAEGPQAPPTPVPLGPAAGLLAAAIAALAALAAGAGNVGGPRDVG
ncbi:MAG: hypothetical protein AAF763_03855 [Pseudomonadota bacterium]